ncbi:SseB family protein [Plantactinospora sp. KLBMP9567]|uniref:SseB family protein n=1 Tax=Plantactinospora sp. KLBMP9567 TaxID=3085900 RepID=UPI002980D504|nr:SseB family protein [Plantactinospora sp. KLBMP9567]MDW5327698.1 SseB family protein [Plantactinospora sp. KLBMP9567]MDW5329174.1 SseB family protein [Plantactinospora sp. KLBMP9567]
MTEWEPATETEAAMRDALRAGDQELYFRILARTDLLLPVSAEALAGRAPMGWGTWTTGGRTHVLAFTSTAALRACLAENAGSTRQAPYPELATGWPNPEWWLAVNPGLPIEGYLPAWFVSQLSRGDVRLPGRSVGARARLEQVERAARARATAAVPRRPPDGPRAEPEPAGGFRAVDPDGLPLRPIDPDGLPSRSPGALRESADSFRPMDADAFRAADAEPFRAAGADAFRATDADSFRAMDADAFRSMDADAFRSTDPDSPGPPLRSPGASREAAESFRSMEPESPAHPFRPAESSREPAEASRSVEASDEQAPIVPPTGEPTAFLSSPEPAPAPATASGTPATVPVIAPTPARSGLGGDFGSQISEDTSAGWMTPAGPTRPTSANTANGSSAAVQGSAGPASSVSAPPSGGAPGGPPPAWHGYAGQQVDRPAEPVETRTPEEWPGTPVAPWMPPSEVPAPEVPAPETWTPPVARSEPSLFTPVPRRPAGDSPSVAGEPWSGATAEGPTTAYELAGSGRPGTDPVPASRAAADPEPTEARPTEQILTGTGLTQSFSGRSFATESLTMGSLPTQSFGAGPAPTEQFTAGPSATEQFAAGRSVREQFAAAPSVSDQFAGGSQPTERFANDPAVTEQFGPGSAPTEPIPASARPPAAGWGTTGPVAAEPPAGADPVPARRLPSDFVPANEVERSLLDAAGDGSTDTFLSTLLLARVLLPVAFNSAPGARPGDDGFEWRTELLDGERYVVVFTSPERLGDHLPETIDTVEVKFAQLIRRWPDDNYSFAVNPGTPVGAKLPGGQIVALANWAAEVGLGDDTGEPAPQAPAEEEAPRPTYAPARDDPGRPTMMQKTIAPSQLSYYLDRGYDRVSGFVHRASEVAHLRTPAKLYAALGLHYPGSPFDRDAEEIYVLRWPAYRPSLYRIPYGGQNEAAMRAMEGWVIERPPFRGNGFAPGESSDVVAEFKVDSVRLPHGAQLHRIGLDGTERLVATLDCDVPLWRRAEEG